MMVTSINTKKKGQKMNTITLKRIIMVKVIVTELFKENLVGEIRHTAEEIDKKMTQERTQVFNYVDQLTKEGKPDEAKMLVEKSKMHWAQTREQLADLAAKIKEAENLCIGSEFTQGPLEGPVEVTVGDNLYKKVGATEILLKDGKIIEIRNQEGT